MIYWENRYWPLIISYPDRKSKGVDRMLWNILDKLFDVIAGNRKPQQPGWTRDLGDGYALHEEDVPNSLGGYHPVNLTLLHNGKKVRQITDETGTFLQFPGVVPGAWEAKQTYPFQPCTRFTFWMGPFQDGKAPVEWLLQPDGRYYADEDGFGWEDDEDIVLHSLMDTTGKFIVPFSEERICQGGISPKR